MNSLYLFYFLLYDCSAYMYVCMYVLSTQKGQEGQWHSLTRVPGVTDGRLPP